MKRLTYITAVFFVFHFPSTASAQQNSDRSHFVDVVESYVAAALDGRTSDASQLAKPDTVPAEEETIEQIDGVLHTDSIPLSHFLHSESDNVALVISGLVTLADPDRDQQRIARLVFTVSKTGDNWVLEDIDIESETGVAGEVERFQKRSPDAKSGTIAKYTSVGTLDLRQGGQENFATRRGESPLEFRILPNPPEADRQPMLTQAVFDSMKKELPPSGDLITELQGNRFRWCEVDSSVKDLPFTTEHDGRTFAVVSADPSRALQWQPGWAICEVESSSTPDQPNIRTLGIDLDNLGAACLRELTKTNLHNRLAIIVGGKIVSAPTIRGEISSRAKITGSFTDEEWDRLTGVLFAAAGVPPTTGSHQEAIDDDAPVTFDQMKVFSLQNIDATEAKTLLAQLYDEKEASVAVGPDSGALVVRGLQSPLEEIEALLLRLDTQGSGESASEQDLSPATFEHAVAELREDYGRHEQEAARLAAEIRELKAASPPDSQQIESKLADLRAVIQQAFEARQKLQDEEVKRLRQRLDRIEKQILVRDQAKQRIIDRRIEDLTNPDLQWQPGPQRVGEEE